MVTRVVRDAALLFRERFELFYKLPFRSNKYDHEIIKTGVFRCWGEDVAASEKFVSKSCFRKPDFIP